MDEKALQEWQELINLHIRRLILSDDQMLTWYSAIEQKASDIIVDKYAKELDIDEDKLLSKHKVYFERLTSTKGINGAYNFENNITILDKTRAMMQKSDAILTTIHEGVHFGQARVAARMINKKDIDHICLNSANNKERRRVFGILTKGETYIRSKGAYPGQGELRACHYKLQFVERQAREITIEIGKQLGLDVTKKEEELQQATELLKARYGCHKISDEKFFGILDESQKRIALNERPRDRLEASIMYDLATLMHEQEYYLQKNDEERSKYKVESQRYFDWDRKANVLQMAGFEYANVIPFNCAKDISLEEISSMSQVLRDQSPLFMLYAIHEFDKDVAPYINKESFDKWYFAHNQYFSQDMIWEVADALGEKYNQIGMVGINCDEKTLRSFADENGKLMDMDLQEFYDKADREFSDLLHTVFTQEEAHGLIDRSAAETIEIIDDDLEEDIDISDKR